MFVFILMIMPMVQIGPVFMSVLSRFVSMQVCMFHCVPRLIMIVIMMEPIMAVEVLMQYKIMSVEVDMLLAEDNHEGDHNNHSSQCLSTGEGLTKCGHRQQQTK
jgi:hypothetical protein